MNQIRESFLRRASGKERGQVLIIMAGILLAMMGVAGLTIDAARIYVSYRQLQSSTDAAALAGAGALPNSNAATVASKYSGQSGSLNAYSNLPTVTPVSGYPLLGCEPAKYEATIPLPPCPNLIQVRQQVTVPTYFIALFGTPKVTLTAVATGAMRGASRSPYNVAVVLDSTASMNDNDSNCGNTRIACALSGVQTFLQALSPCSSSLGSNPGCGSATNNSSGGGANVSSAVDRVSLFTFPAVSTTTAPDDYNCGRSTPAIVPYTYPFPSTSTYQIVNFSSDYRTSVPSTTLNGSSDIVDAVGGKSGCGIQAIGGEGTYFAQAITQAQAALVSEQSTLVSQGITGTQNVMVIVSDGDASPTVQNGQTVWQAAAAQMPGANGINNTSTAYPSIFYRCNQAVTQAQGLENNGTTLYVVAYGAQTSTSGYCTTDNTAPPVCSAKVTTDCLPAGATTKPISPCATLQQMVTNSNPPTGGITEAPATYFFSDYTTTGGDSGCTGRNLSYTSLSQIFTAIAGDLTVPRLVPDSVFAPN